MAEDIDITVNVFGAEQVESAMDNIAVKAEQMGSRVVNSSNSMDMGFKRMTFAISSLTMSSFHLVDVFDRLASGQMDIVRGSAYLAMNILHLVGNLYMLGAASWAVVLAEKARAIASFIANAVGSAGILVPLMIAGVAAAAIVSTTIPTRHTGGNIPFSGLYNLQAGERVLKSGESNSITVNVYGAGSPRETGQEVVNALVRAGYA